MCKIVNMIYTNLLKKLAGRFSALILKQSTWLPTGLSRQRSWSSDQMGWCECTPRDASHGLRSPKHSRKASHHQQPKLLRKVVHLLQVSMWCLFKNSIPHTLVLASGLFKIQLHFYHLHAVCPSFSKLRYHEGVFVCTVTIFPLSCTILHKPNGW